MMVFYVALYATLSLIDLVFSVVMLQAGNYMWGIGGALASLIWGYCALMHTPEGNQ